MLLLVGSNYGKCCDVVQWSLAALLCLIRQTYVLFLKTEASNFVSRSNTASNQETFSEQERESLRRRNVHKNTIVGLAMWITYLRNKRNNTPNPRMFSWKQLNGGRTFWVFPEKLIRVMNWSSLKYASCQPDDSREDPVKFKRRWWRLQEPPGKYMEVRRITAKGIREVTELARELRDSLPWLSEYVEYADSDRCGK